MRHVVDEFVTIFGFDVDERTLNRGRVAVDRMRGQLDQGTRAANGMNTGVRNLVMGWVGLQTLIGGSRALVNANVELENLRAAMVVTTGSVEAADEAFAAVRQFALRSPDELAEVTRAYQTLVGVGVDPLEERLTRLGDTAAAMQVPLDTLVDATVRAATGEAEALRTISSRFGIRFKSENRVLFAEMGDDLVRVGNNAAEALAFIEDLGANRFAGAMEVRANTLAGRFSMLS
ncbi:MAG: hypothetical protein ACPGWS_09530, partial [Solirubrobacterales bacterium]